MRSRLRDRQPLRHTPPAGGVVGCLTCPYVILRDERVSAKKQRVVVDVHDAGVRGDLLGDLVGVLRGRQAGAQVEKLPDPGLGQVAFVGGDDEVAAPEGALDDAGVDGAVDGRGLGR